MKTINDTTRKPTTKLTIDQVKRSRGGVRIKTGMKAGEITVSCGTGMSKYYYNWTK